MCSLELLKERNTHKAELLGIVDLIVCDGFVREVSLVEQIHVPVAITKVIYVHFTESLFVDIDLNSIKSKWVTFRRGMGRTFRETKRLEIPIFENHDRLKIKVCFELRRRLTVQQKQQLKILLNVAPKYPWRRFRLQIAFQCQGFIGFWINQGNLCWIQRKEDKYGRTPIPSFIGTQIPLGTHYGGPDEQTWDQFVQQYGDKKLKIAFWHRYPEDQSPMALLRDAHFPVSRTRVLTESDGETDDD